MRGLCRAHSVLARVYLIVKHLKHNLQLVDELKAAGQQAPKPSSSRQPEAPEADFSDEPKKVK